MSNAVNWFEIPCADLDRAQTFYEKMLDRPLHREDFGGELLAVFPHDKPGAGGCLQAGAHSSAPAGRGIRVYLDCSPSLDAALARAVAAGGQIVQPRFELPKGIGVIAHIRDTEGNEVGLHALA